MTIDTTRPVYGALDLAFITGTAAGNAFEPPVTETWRLCPYGAEDTGRSQRFTVLRARIIPWVLRWNFAHVFIEEPLDARAMARLGTPIATQVQLTGLVAVAEQVLDEYGIPTSLIHRQTVLGHFTGIKRYKDKDDGKRACVARCRQMRWNVNGFDEADAAALLDTGCASLDKRGWAMAGIGRPLPARVEISDVQERKTNRKRARIGGIKGKKSSGLFG